ncbi:hypothetical protein A4R26_25900 [Niastella populi]|uniref:Uncharacterized protein n=1 Tax=Niastella populi TaxID=550983 RepID=A0A1V9FD86_9BACT|nr:hypothetical protein A4R26_25900 [Niastella populi]
MEKSNLQDSDKEPVTSVLQVQISCKVLKAGGSIFCNKKTAISPVSSMSGFPEGLPENKTLQPRRAGQAL